MKMWLCLMALASTAAASNFTNWVEFSENPIYAPYSSISLGDDYFPSVLFDKQRFHGHGDRVLYKMWHQSESGLALSYSNDGINWTLKAEVIVDPSAYHPSVIYDRHGFGGGPYFYKMWYWTGDASPTPPALPIQFAQSTDGITWTTPVATTQDTTAFLSDATAPSTPFHQMYGFGQVIFNPYATSTPEQPLSFPYITYYDSSAGGLAPFTSQEAVALAYSSDGLNWIRYGTSPVLIPSGNVSDWDGLYAFRGAVVKLDLDNLYHMFYTGSNGQGDIGLFYAHGIGHAFSTDGINWIKDSDNPIFITTNGVAWRGDRSLAPSVVVSLLNHRCPLLQMWFSGGNSSAGGLPESKKIGYATLPNPDEMGPKH